MNMSSDGKRSLTDATDTLSTRVNALSRQLTISQRQQVVMRWLLGIAVLLTMAALVGAFVVYNISDDNQKTQKSTCEYGNSTRAGQRKAWGELLNVSTASAKAQAEQAGVEPPPEVLAYYAEFTKWINTKVFPDRDCDHLDSPLPPISQPPSFEKALREALKDAKTGG